jgi:hypothetical protein
MSYTIEQLEKALYEVGELRYFDTSRINDKTLPEEKYNLRLRREGDWEATFNHLAAWAVFEWFQSNKERLQEELRQAVKNKFMAANAGRRELLESMLAVHKQPETSTIKKCMAFFKKGSD